MEQHYDPENAVSNNGNGIENNNRATAPNTLNPMTEDYMNAANNPTVTEDYTTDADISNPDVLVSDGATMPEPFEPTPSSGLPDEFVGQTDTGGEASPIWSLVYLMRFHTFSCDWQSIGMVFRSCGH